MSLKILEGFRFLEGTSLIHRLDPRVKMFFALTFMILALLFDTIIPQVILFLLVFPFIIVAQRVGRWFQTLKGISIFLVLILTLNSIFTTFAGALAMAMRLVVLISCFSVFFLTVHPDDLTAGLVALKLPFSFSFSIGLAFRYVPTLATEVQTIMEAQKSRGLELDKGGLYTRVKNFIPILVPLVLLSIRRSLLVAESLESRGFGSSKKRSFFQVLKMHSRDWAVMIFLICCLVIGIMVKIFPSFFPAWIFAALPFSG